MCVGSLALCLALALWQWEQYSAAGGSVQNLGYVLQWPLFGLFPAFVFLRMRALSKKAEQRGDQATGPGTSETALVLHSTSARASRHAMLERDEEPDDALAEYNRYLAELNARAEGRG